MLAVAPHSLGAMFAVASGVSFTLIGFAYKIGQPRRVIPAQIMLVMCAIGAALYGARSAGVDLSAMPAIVWVAGVVIGITQWVMLVLLSAALRQGPLSGAWCAVSLSFIPVFVYAYAVFGQAPRTTQLVSAFLAAMCVVSASFNQGSQTQDIGVKPGWRLLSYGLLLAALLLVNSVLGVGQYDLSQRAYGDSTLLANYADVFYTVLYLTLVACLLAHLLVRRLTLLSGWMWGLGVLAGAGSVCGLWTQGQAAGYVGAVTYAIGGAAGLITAGIVGALAFKEKPTVLWYATILLGVLAVVVGYI